jgi:hypothetical protein
VRKTLGSFINSAGGRRWALSLLALASAHTLAWYAKISGDAYAITVGATVGAFIAGVTAQKIKGADGG